MLNFLAALALTTLAPPCRTLNTPTDSVLTQAEQARLRQGEQVCTLRPWRESPVPVLRVYHLLRATPQEAAAVFFDYEAQPGYIESLGGSRVIRQLEPTVADVEVRVRVPGPDQTIVTRDTVSMPVPDSTYRIGWGLVHGRFVRAVDGSLLLTECHRELRQCAGTLMIYEYALVPSGLAIGPLRAWIRHDAVDTALEAAKSIARQVECVVASRSPALTERVARLRAALAGQQPAAGKAAEMGKCGNEGVGNRG